VADIPSGSEYRLQVQPEVLIEAHQELHNVADELNAGHRRLVGERCRIFSGIRGRARLVGCSARIGRSSRRPARALSRTPG
jgi:hypothetical protein